MWQIPKTRRPRVANVLSFGRRVYPAFCDTAACPPKPFPKRMVNRESEIKGENQPSAILCHLRHCASLSGLLDASNETPGSPTLQDIAFHGVFRPGGDVAGPAWPALRDDGDGRASGCVRYDGLRQQISRRSHQKGPCVGLRHTVRCGCRRNRRACRAGSVLPSIALAGSTDRPFGHGIRSGHTPSANRVTSNTITRKFRRIS
ncbi:hypothetical protein ABIC16_004081 [Sphingomonas sp. PvP055]